MQESSSGSYTTADTFSVSRSETDRLTCNLHNGSLKFTVMHMSLINPVASYFIDRCHDFSSASAVTNVEGINVPCFMYVCNS